MTTFIEQIQRSARPSAPRRTVVYGTEGIGKSTWCANVFPDPCFIPTEDGIRDLDVKSYPLVTTTEQMRKIGRELMAIEPDDIPFKSLVVDSVDWLEYLISRDVCGEFGVDGLTKIDFRRGDGEVVGRFRSFLDRMNTINREKEIWVTLISHAGIREESVDGGQKVSMVGPDLMKECRSAIMEWADEVLYCKYDTPVDVVDEGFNRSRRLLKGVGDRVVYSVTKDQHRAKHRLKTIETPSFPMEFDGANYRQFLGLLPKTKGQL